MHYITLYCVCYTSHDVVDFLHFLILCVFMNEAENGQIFFHSYLLTFALKFGLPRLMHSLLSFSLTRIASSIESFHRDLLASAACVRSTSCRSTSCRTCRCRESNERPTPSGSDPRPRDGSGTLASGNSPTSDHSCNAETLAVSLQLLGCSLPRWSLSLWLRIRARLLTTTRSKGSTLNCRKRSLHRQYWKHFCCNWATNTCEAASVTRLGNFWKFLEINFLIK